MLTCCTTKIKDTVCQWREHARKSCLRLLFMTAWLPIPNYSTTWLVKSHHHWQHYQAAESVITGNHHRDTTEFYHCKPAKRVVTTMRLGSTTRTTTWPNWCLLQASKSICGLLWPWPPDPQSCTFHALILWTTCAKWHQNQFKTDERMNTDPRPIISANNLQLSVNIISSVVQCCFSVTLPTISSCQSTSYHQ